jgi:hypothetical protein
MWPATRDDARCGDHAAKSPIRPPVPYALFLAQEARLEMATMTDDARLEFIENLLAGYCAECGRVAPGGCNCNEGA